MRKCLLYLDKLPFYKVLLVLTFVFIVYNVFSSNLIDWLGLDLMENTYFDSYTLEELFGIVVLCAPILETLIFQLLSIELVIFGLTKLNLGSHRGILIIAGIVSAILFGLSHSYSIHYIVLSFVGGLIMSFTFLYTRQLYNVLSAFVGCVVVHSGSNLAAFCLNLVFDS